MFVESGEVEEGVFLTIVANDGNLYEREYVTELFNIRLASLDECEEFIALNPYQKSWLEKFVYELVVEHCGLNDKPSIILDGNETIY